MKPEKVKRYNDFYMDVAQRVALMSHAVRLQVGCILVKDGNIISFGWNGMPAGWDNDCELVEFMPGDAGGWLDPTEIWHQWPHEGKFWIDGVECDKRYRLKTRPEVLHAESNCISKLAKSNNSGLGADLYVTHSPCMECAKLIHQSGISRVFYSENYRDNAGLEFLQKSGVHVEHYPKL